MFGMSGYSVSEGLNFTKGEMDRYEEMRIKADNGEFVSMI